MPATPARVAPVSAAQNGCGPWCTRNEAGDGAVFRSRGASSRKTANAKAAKVSLGGRAVALGLPRDVPRQAVLGSKP